jgi:hypothetical protein
VTRVLRVAAVVHVRLIGRHEGFLLAPWRQLV